MSRNLYEMNALCILGSLRFDISLYPKTEVYKPALVEEYLKFVFMLFRCSKNMVQYHFLISIYFSLSLYNTQMHKSTYGVYIIF